MNIGEETRCDIKEIELQIYTADKDENNLERRSISSHSRAAETSVAVAAAAAAAAAAAGC